MSVQILPCKGCNQLRPSLKQPTPEDPPCEDCDLPSDTKTVFGFEDVWLKTILSQQDEQIKLLKTMMMKQEEHLDVLLKNIFTQHDEQIKLLKAMVEKQEEKAETMVEQMEEQPKSVVKKTKAHSEAPKKIVSDVQSKAQQQGNKGEASRKRRVASLPLSGERKKKVKKASRKETDSSSSSEDSSD